jgi:hypothetical protein
VVATGGWGRSKDGLIDRVDPVAVGGTPARGEAADAGMTCVGNDNLEYDADAAADEDDGRIAAECDASRSISHAAVSSSSST